MTEARWEVASRLEPLTRDATSRLVALLAASTGDIAAAEDAVGDALERALRSWPASGIPANPEAWLLTVARNRLRDRWRSAAAQRTRPVDPDVDPPVDARSSSDARTVDPAAVDPDAIPDRRLELLFVCAHPAIDPTVRTPLMLNVVMGLEASRIAIAFAVPTATMAQRLVRAKRRIAEAGIPFVVPDRSAMPARLGPVLEAVYGAYAIDGYAVAGAVPVDSLAAESLALARLLATLLPGEPEALGLAALIGLSIARSPAREADGEIVPTDEQDVGRWDHVLIAESDALLAAAHALGRPGRFQLEAAIQSAHCARARTGRVDRAAIATLYEALLAIAPTRGARVAHAAALAEVAGPQVALDALDGSGDEALERFQPAWAVRAHLLAVAGRRDDARDAYDRAIALTTVPAERAFLAGRRARLADAVRPDGQP